MKRHHVATRVILCRALFGPLHRNGVQEVLETLLELCEYARVRLAAPDFERELEQQVGVGPQEREMLLTRDRGALEELDGLARDATLHETLGATNVDRAATVGMHERHVATALEHTDDDVALGDQLVRHFTVGHTLRQVDQAELALVTGERRVHVVTAIPVVGDALARRDLPRIDPALDVANDREPRGCSLRSRRHSVARHARVRTTKRVV